MKTPVEIAQSVCSLAQKKASWSVPQMLILGALAGAYVAFGGWGMTVTTFDVETVGIAKMIAGTVFSLGLILVVLAGGELFTGNCVMPLAVMAGCLPMKAVVRNWFWVYTANLIGAVVVAVLIYNTGLWRGDIGAKALSIAAGKMGLTWWEAFFRGIMCNWIVVLAVWLTMGAEDVIGKIWAIYFPILVFVASGFEHSIANMYFMALGILIKGDPTVLASHLAPADLGAVTIWGYFNNLIPVTAGNIVGGVLFVAVLYFSAFKKYLVKS
ncbi:formate/nitrite transporter family protein [Dethiosulfovibrio salsuginis]|uniref:Formate/nitrite transporter n=1 Tax=Dethiosulfovibrio salsuginis TaxID=561720 RepID=A0A1X7L5D8_9BACT|nr:formate/nitrite transporter family protein [Dethiosulfovibrio salsuginis]SMG48603.1 formate/nitrite transporter [Dethiosulfovibrio salsuginis]